MYAKDLWQQQMIAFMCRKCSLALGKQSTYPPKEWTEKVVAVIQLVIQDRPAVQFGKFQIRLSIFRSILLHISIVPPDNLTSTPLILANCFGHSTCN